MEPGVIRAAIFPVCSQYWGGGMTLFSNNLLCGKKWKKVVSTARLFADDCLLYKTINSKNAVEALQKDLQTLEKWQEIGKSIANGIQPKQVLHNEL